MMRLAMWSKQTRRAVNFARTTAAALA